MNAKQPITHDGRYIYDADGRVVYRCSDIAWEAFKAGAATAREGATN